MTKVKETNEKATILNGAVLTDKVIKRIIDYQEHDNEQIKAIRNTIADAIGIINKNLSSEEFREKEILDVLSDLSFIRDYYLDFKKP